MNLNKKVSRSSPLQQICPSDLEGEQFSWKPLSTQHLWFESRFCKHNVWFNQTNAVRSKQFIACLM